MVWLRHGVSFLERAEIKPVEPDPAHTGEGMSVCPAVFYAVQALIPLAVRILLGEGNYV